MDEGLVYLGGHLRFLTSPTQFRREPSGTDDETAVLPESGAEGASVATACLRARIGCLADHGSDESTDYGPCSSLQDQDWRFEERDDSSAGVAQVSSYTGPA